MSATGTAPHIEPSQVPHVSALGIEIVESGHGRLVMRLPAQPTLIGNPDSGALFGGAVFTLMDTVCGFLTLASVPDGQPAATLDLRVDYVAPARGDRDLYAEALCTRVTRQVVFCRASAWQDDPESPVATALCSFMINRPAAEPVAGSR